MLKDLAEQGVDKTLFKTRQRVDMQFSGEGCSVLWNFTIYLSILGIFLLKTLDLVVPIRSIENNENFSI